MREGSSLLVGGGDWGFSRSVHVAHINHIKGHPGPRLGVGTHRDFSQASAEQPCLSQMRKIVCFAVRESLIQASVQAFRFGHPVRGGT